MQGLRGQGRAGGCPVPNAAVMAGAELGRGQGDKMGGWRGGAGRPKAKFRGNGEPRRAAAGQCGRTGIARPSRLDAEWTEWAGGALLQCLEEDGGGPRAGLEGGRAGVRALTTERCQETPPERSSWSWEDPLSRVGGYPSPPAGPFPFLGHWEGSGPRRPGSNSGGGRATSEHQGRQAGGGRGKGTVGCRGCRAGVEVPAEGRAEVWPGP